MADPTGRRRKGPSRVLYLRVPVEIHDELAELAYRADMSISRAAALLLGDRLGLDPPFDRLVAAEKAMGGARQRRRRIEQHAERSDGPDAA